MPTTVIVGPYYFEANTPERKPFLVISTVLILIELAGGDFKSDVSALGGAITLQRPEILYWAAWVYFVFQAFRYWQSIGSKSLSFMARAYEHAVSGRMKRDPKFREFAEPYLTQAGFTWGKEAGTPRVHRTLFRRYLDFRPERPYPGSENLPMYKVQLRQLLVHELRAHWRLTILDSFWFERYFPWAWALVAIGIAVLPRLWSLWP
ncbi:MAG: hypothetical protein GEV05_14335 [Betaproteobacteria bacterium]|nr:hypothetical protein [Betaproteobacteria bacterium]